LAICTRNLVNRAALFYAFKARLAEPIDRKGRRIMTTTPGISGDFPFKSNYVDVHGSRIHYVDEGTGDSVLFLHGQPT
jgi:hypothetical protein